MATPFHISDSDPRIAEGLAIAKTVAGELSRRWKLNFDDLFSPAQAAVVDAIKAHDPGKPFAPFANVVIRRAVISDVRKNGHFNRDGSKRLIYFPSDANVKQAESEEPIELPQLPGIEKIDPAVELYARVKGKLICLRCGKATQARLPNHNSGCTAAGMLTKAQRTVAYMLAQGMGVKEIASSLNNSVKTIEAHKYEIYRRMGFSNIAQLIRYFVSEELSGEKRREEQ